MPRYRFAVLLAVVLLVAPSLTALPAAVEAAGQGFAPPEHYYLAIGDSFAFGLQFAKLREETKEGTYDPATFTTGYADDFAAMLRNVNPYIKTINYGCPGETTGSFISGGCAFHTGGRALHNDYPAATAQLTQTLSFLASHRGRVGPITLNLGFNDVRTELFVGICKQEISCTEQRLPGVLAQLRANLDAILTALQTASPSSEIILLTAFDPDIATSPQTVPFYLALNATLTTVAEAHGVRVADGFSAFTPATICGLVLICGTPPDFHPSNAGYRLLAETLWRASGYDRLGSTEDGCDEITRLGDQADGCIP